MQVRVYWDRASEADVVELDAVPREGEWLLHDGDRHKVFEVEHDPSQEATVGVTTVHRTARWA